MQKKLIIGLICLAMVLPILAQATTIEALGIEQPRILPGHPFYFIKDGWRKIREVFTFNSVEKMELGLQFSGERLIELEELAEKNAEESLLEKAREKYAKEGEKLEQKAMQIQQKAQENPRISLFLDKYIQHEQVHQQVLERIQKQVPEEVAKRIIEQKEVHLERFSKVMIRLESKESISERIMENIGEGETPVQNLEKLEFVERVMEKMPEETKAKLEQTKERVRVKIEEQLENTSEETKNQIRNYFEEGIKNQNEIKARILKQVQEKAQAPETKRILEEVQAKLMPIKEEFEQKNQGTVSPKAGPNSAK